MDKIIRALIGLCLIAISGFAAAMPISGTINIGGGSQVLYDATTNKSTGIDFYCGGSYACGGAVNMFPAPTGDFASLAYLTLSTMNGGLTLNSFLYSNIPQQKIWEINSGGYLYSFTLTSMQVVSGDQKTGCGTGYFGCLVLSGNGYFSITDMYGSSVGYTDTAGSWVYSQSGASFSSQSASVTEPGTMALLGLGLLGIGVASRFRKSS